MMNILGNLKPAPGARKKEKRIGRGQGSGHGKTSTRGHKGEGSRSGTTYRPWFEGGQMPLSRRIPKFGFHSPFRVAFQEVNVGRLETLAVTKKVADGTVTPQVLYDLGVVSRKSQPVKILGDGELKTKLEVHAHAFSKAAIQKIEAAGGKVEILGRTETARRVAPLLKESPEGTPSGPSGKGPSVDDPTRRKSSTSGGSVPKEGR